MHPASVRTRIIATIGPASESVEGIASLLEAGADAFRLNLAHGSPGWHEQAVRRIREVSRGAGRPVAILADLAGPKIRLKLPAGGSVSLADGALVRFVRDEDPRSGLAGAFTLTWPPLLEQLRPGHRILLGDGAVRLEVEEASARGAAGRVVQGGTVRSGAGVNVPGAALAIEPLTPKDLKDIAWMAGLGSEGIDYVALSFTRRADDVTRLRSEMARAGLDAAVMAKIEREEALASLDAILAVADAVMVARGDLGLEIDVARMAAVQKDVARRANAARVPVVIATQMLESMRTAHLPTRAEATDVANAILDGADALLLTGETALGEHPAETVAMMNRIAQETEPLAPAGPRTHAHGEGLVEPLVEAAARLADEVGARLIVVGTRTGRTARLLSQQRCRTPILGVSDEEATVRRMALYGGVTPRHVPGVREGPVLLGEISVRGLADGRLRSGDRIVLVAGARWSASGHDGILVHHV
jgi:pyruvate kinase